MADARLPLHVYRVLNQLTVHDAPELVADMGDEFVQSMRAFRDFFVGMHADQASHPAALIRRLPELARRDVASLLARADRTVLADLVASDAAVLRPSGLAQRVAYRVVREHLGKPPLARATVTRHMHALAEDPSVLARARRAAAARDAAALARALRPLRLASSVAASSEAAWEWVGALLALADEAPSPSAADGDRVHALCLRAARLVSVEVRRAAPREALSTDEGPRRHARRAASRTRGRGVALRF
jgi:hypothetical protein